ncbi:5-oxoprolinase subunit PxpA [Maribacter aestuarii]|uniref:5-oxoprolinase subunit PxpA n=1 Tax=Maribacter aestuarii TaxID=1130723 RepID=UPI00248B5DD5|nr:5-oxoprolinase subunit PxpA [Maribacter aestuarii]
MDKIYIDINCDVGEGMGIEADIFPLISSCSIACGGHAGDTKSMTKMVELAQQHKVKIGAHPSYPDKLNFGRVSLKMDAKELADSVQTQIESLKSISEKSSIPLHHIKPHGALYNDIAKDEKLATIFLEAIAIYKSDLFLYVPPGSVIEVLAQKNGFKIKLEAFGDRNYTADLKLVSRKHPDALITAPEAVLNHLLEIIKIGRVRTVTGDFRNLMADTYCIHGDTRNALQILTYLSLELPNHKIYITK